MKLAKHATSIALIVCAVVVATYAYVVDRGSVSDAERKQRENDVFPAYRREQVDRVELLRPGEDLVIERDLSVDGGDASWRLSSPRTEPADGAAVEKLLGALEFATIVRKVDATAAMGLDAPRVRGMLAMGKLVYHFVLGGSAPTPEGAAYLRVDGEGTYVVSRELTTELLRGADSYRTRTIVPYLSLDLSKLEVTSASGTVTIERMDETSFRLPARGLRASRVALDRIWSALAEMRAEAFLDDSAAERATAHPAFGIRMVPKETGKPPAELLVGDACPGHPEDVVVVRKTPTPLSACAPKGVLAGLATTEDSLVDKHLFAAHADETEELHIEALPTGTRVEIARKGTGWHERSPSDRDLTGEEADAASALVDALMRVEATRVERGDGGSLQPARSRATIKRVESGGDEIVELGPFSTDRKEAVVRRLADGALLYVPVEGARKLVPSEIALRAHAVFAPPIDGRTPVRLSVRCDEVNEELTRDENGWTLREPTGFVVDSSTLSGVMDAVAHARADAWVADADDGRFGFDKSTCNVTVAYADEAGARTVSLVFGGEGEGGFYTRVEGVPGIFVAPRSLRESLARWAIDRTAFRIDPVGIARVSLTRGGKRIDVFRDGDKLVGPDGGIDLGASVEEAFATLAANEVVHIGGARPEEGLASPSLDVRVRVQFDGGGRDVHFVVGQATEHKDETMYYARIDAVNATFVIAKARLAPLLAPF